jgi:hypothetical protein
VTFHLVTELFVVPHIRRRIWTWQSDTGFHLIICGLDINYTLRNSYEQGQVNEERKAEGGAGLAGQASPLTQNPNKLLCTAKLVPCSIKLIAIVNVLGCFFLTLDDRLFHRNEEWCSSLLSAVRFAQKPTSAEVSYINIWTCTGDFVIHSCLY